MKNDIANRIIMTLLIFISVVILLCIYLIAFHENPPVVFNNLPFPVDKEEYRIGDTIIVTIDYCKKTNAAYTRIVSFVDGIIFSVSDSQRGGSAPGCGVVNVRSETIPEGLPPGEYYLRGKNIYHVNFIADRVVLWETERFIVAP